MLQFDIQMPFQPLNNYNQMVSSLRTFKFYILSTNVFNLPWQLVSFQDSLITAQQSFQQLRACFTFSVYTFYRDETLFPVR